MNRRAFLSLGPEPENPQRPEIRGGIYSNPLSRIILGKRKGKAPVPTALRVLIGL